MTDWKHRKAETDVEALLRSAARLDPSLVTTYPRPVKDILCAALPVAFECHRGLTAKIVVQVLGDVYGVDHSELLEEGDGALGGYTFARGELAVVFAEIQYGESFERFTIAHEAAHIAVEYLPQLARGRQAELFGGTQQPALFARRDPPGHFFSGTSNGNDRPTADYERLRADHAAWLREVVANACAAELLAPHREVTRALTGLGTNDRVATVQERFGLSRRAAEVRLSELGLIPNTSTLTFFFD